MEKSFEENKTTFHVGTNVSASLAFDAAMRDKYEKLLLDSIRSELLYTYSTPLSAGLIVLYTICFLVGLVGNLLVMSVVLRSRRMHTITNKFLGNLAVCDLMVICFCVPSNIALEAYRSYMFGDALCRVLPYIQGISVSGSVLSLTVISLDRFHSLSHQGKPPRSFLKQNSIVVLVLIWVVSMAIMSPLLFVNHLDHVTLDFGLSENLTLAICKEDWPSDAGKQQYSVTLFVFHLIIPAAIMILANALVGKKLWRADDIDEVENATRLESGMISHAVVASGLKRQRGIVKMLVALLSVFFVFWTPYYVITLWLDFRIGKHWEENSVAGNVYPFTLFLGLANSAINPICYSLMNARFREATKDVFSRKMQWIPPSSETTNTENTEQVSADVFSL
ncbi:NPFFR2 [Branchiostoma lanceolatum]|uniref:NPFFR2 protein n=1 Tax=Branchiostoma lanceolatum TaxID=7740 RepID=A0A8K0AFH8_BRALA|nr:NPFFR2 [Branchiostoma lanceolatum]